MPASITRRQQEALDLRIQGLTYSRIGAAMGVSEMRAHQLVAAALKRREESSFEKIDQIRRIELERLDQAVQTVIEILEKGTSIVVTKDGDVVEVMDSELRLKAIDRLTKISERRSKLVGLDAPASSEHTIKGPWEKFMADVVDHGDGDDDQEAEPDGE